MTSGNRWKPGLRLYGILLSKDPEYCVFLVYFC